MEWNQERAVLIGWQPNPPRPFESRKDVQSWFHSEYVQQAFHDARRYPLKVNANGDFQIENVSPGKYHLRAEVKLLSDSLDAPGGEKPWGMVDEEIDVPILVENDINGSFNLGTFEIVLQNRLKTGDPAPIFSATTIAGDRIELTDFRGKYVLLVFWASWCVPCLSEIPDLKEISKQFGKHHPFVIVGLMNDKKEDAQRVIQRHHINWPQGYFATASERQIPASYGVIPVPDAFLISPEGRIIAAHIKRSDMKELIQSVLKSETQK